MAMSTVERRQHYDKLLQALKTERSTFESAWQELAAYLMPRRTRFYVDDRNKGDKRHGSITDAEPLFAVRTLQHGFHSGMTSPARPWFRLTTPSPDLADQDDVKAWLHDVSERLRTIFLRSNLYSCLPVLYGDLGVFGTAAMAMLEDDKDLLRCYTYPLGSYVIGLDARGVANTFMYEYSRTVSQLVEEFGGMVRGNPDTIDWTRFSPSVKSRWENGQRTDNINVVWAVTPNDDYDPQALDAQYAMPWRSCHYEVAGDKGTFLRESGFRRFPIMAPRWSVTGEDVYGTDCPGMQAIGDTKSLQFMDKKLARAIDKSVDPPLKASANFRTQKVSELPGDITYGDDGDISKSIMPLHEIRMEGVTALDQSMLRREQRVNRAFYADLFLMLANMDQSGSRQPPTATEIQERHEEKLLALGPVLERLNDELLDEIIDRGFDILQAAGGIPPAPPALQGIELKVEYISIMAAAQKLAGVASLDNFINRILSIAPVVPSVVQKVNWLTAVNEYGDNYSVKPTLIVSDEDAQAAIAAAAQQQQQAMQAEQMKNGAQAALALGRTPTQGGSSSALDDLVRATAA